MSAYQFEQEHQNRRHRLFEEFYMKEYEALRKQFKLVHTDPVCKQIYQTLLNRTFSRPYEMAVKATINRLKELPCN